jgi:hypothetical protein|tara:strand:+ start:329 stop:748 length:420 start_codon:yes stop_codon:yes gene_type:complete
MTIANTTVSKTANKSSNATKGNAKVLTDIVMSHRDDKETASKAVSALSKSVGVTLHSPASTDVKKAAIMKAAETAKSRALASIDRQVNRALQLAGVNRGTTGKGGIHCTDVVTEVFSGQSKSDAKSSNTAALVSAGLIS